MAGQPPKYKTPEQMQKKFDEYFADCEEKKLIPNVVGMALFLGFAGRQSLKQYEDRDDIFFDIIKRAKAKAFENKFQLAASGKMNTTIFIFESINNHNMVNTKSDNKNENDNKHSVTIEADPKDLDL